MGLTVVGRRVELWRRWPELLLVLTYWWVRFHNLAAMPAFFDEAVHIRWAKLVWRHQPFHAASDGRLLNIWLYAAFWPFTGALWIARASMLIVAVLGLAALLRSGRELLGPEAARFGAIIYIGLPYAHFFERMALADPLLAPLLSLLILGSAFAARQAAWFWPVLTGLSLAAIQLTKLTGVVFLPVPVLAFALLAKTRNRSDIYRLAISYLTAIIAIAPVIAVLKIVAHSDLGFDLIAVRTQAAPLLQRLSHNLRLLGELRPNYITPGVALALASALILSLVRRRREAVFLFVVMALPLAAVVTGSNVFESRFLAPILPTMAVAAGWGISLLVKGLKAPVRISALGLTVVVWLGLGPAAFLTVSWTTPSQLPLLAGDQFQYFSGWPAGYGVREAAGYIFSLASQTPVDVVAIDEGHIPTLSTYAGPEPHLHALYDYSEPNLRILHLYPDMNDPFAGLADPGTITLLIVESRLRDRLDSLRANRELIAAYPKPGGQSAIELYRIWPLTDG